MRVLAVVLAACAMVSLQAAPAVAVPGEKVDMPAECVFEDGELGSYIVVFHDWVSDPAAVAHQQVKRYDGILGFIYKSALKGYSAEYLPASAEALQAETTIDYIEVDKLTWMDDSSGVIKWHSCPLAPPLGPAPTVDVEAADGPAPQGSSAGDSISPGGQPVSASAPPAPTHVVQCRRARASRGKRCVSGGDRAVRVCNQRAIAAKRRC
jgi:hypothetical protein